MAHEIKVKKAPWTSSEKSHHARANNAKNDDAKKPMPRIDPIAVRTY